MVGIVLVSHSEPLARALADYTKMMAPTAVALPAGGMEDGAFGTSYDKIMAAVEAADEGDGVIVLVDMGSAVMTTKMVLEDLGSVDAKIADCPFVEGAVQATVLAQAGASMEDALAGLSEVAGTHKV